MEDSVDLVVRDLAMRKQFGIERYGVPHNGDLNRDHLLDAYEEALDLCVYLRAEIEYRAAAMLKVEIHRNSVDGVLAEYAKTVKR
jgi:hypothetical protein